MNIYVPSYYQKFRCIAERCRHSCCVGWEIDIDETTMSYYNELDGKIGDRIRKSISGKNPHFELTKDERCPHLNQNGLCNIITELGEDALCDICYDHPRFRNFYSDFVELGLGLTCEAAAELIIKSQDSFEIVPLDIAGTPTMTDDEKNVLDARCQLINIMKERKTDIVKRFENLSKDEICNDLNIWIEHCLGLERLDKRWTDVLVDVKNSDLKAFYPLDAEDKLSVALEQLMIYFLYRHIPSAIDDGRLLEKVRFGVLSCNLINTLCIYQKSRNPKADIVNLFTDIARMYSSEIEYSDENLELIIQKLS